MIQYRHVKRIRNKYDVMISAAGGVALREVGSAVFNGAAIVVANIVHPDAPWGAIARPFVDTIK